MVGHFDKADGYNVLTYVVLIQGDDDTVTSTYVCTCRKTRVHDGDGTQIVSTAYRGETVQVLVVMWLCKIQDNLQLKFWGTTVSNRMSTLGSTDVGMDSVVLMDEKRAHINSRRGDGECAGIGRVLTNYVNGVSRSYGPNLHRASAE